MTLEKLNDIEKVVRPQVFAHLWPGVGVCFSLYQTDDAGPAQLGELFEQSEDFLMVETIIDDTRRIGPGHFAATRVMGGVEITYHTKDRLDPLFAKRRLEEAGDWFRDETIGGVRFRGFVPLSDGRVRGYQTYSATVAFEFEVPAKGL